MSASNRYEGKPLLRLLECYVLRAIDELSAKDIALLEDMTPKLQQVYNSTGAWWEVIENVMELPSELPAAIREVWEKNMATAKDKELVLSPQHFAEMFVDQNLVV